MRLRARSTVLLAGLLLLGLPALAAAEPKPIAKPERIAPIQPAHSSQPSTPPARSTPSSTPSSSKPPPASPPPASPPPARTTQKPANTGSAVGSTSGSRVTSQPAKETVVVLDASGGRDQSGIAVPAPPPPEPTPLGLVTAGERVAATSPGTSTPAWKVALLALLAAGEAFLVVRLVRNRSRDLSGDLSPAR